jgi:hypothetical protein
MNTRTVRPGDLERDLVGRLAALNDDVEARRRSRAHRRSTKARPRRGRARLSGFLAVVALLALGAQAVWADGGTLDVQVDNATQYAVDTTDEGAIVEYIGKDNVDFGASGSGIFESFVQIQDTPKEEGYNTDGVSEFDTGSSPTFNHAVLVSEIPTVTCASIDGSETASGLCWELFADINDSNANDPNAAQIQLTDLEVWFTADNEITGYDQGGTGFGADGSKVYDFDGLVLINDVNSGSGRGDLRYLIPIESIAIPADCGFGDSDCATYFILYSEWGETDPAGDFISDSGFEEWKVKRYPFVEVEKTAVAEFTRTFGWTIDKTVDPAEWDLFEGDTGTSEYTVTVDKDAGTDTDPAVSGTITITNTSDRDAIITSVTDEISGGPTAGDVDCGAGVTFPYELDEGDTLVCTYTADLPDATDQTNTATVTLAEGTVFTGEADVDFGDPTTVVNDTINVDDSVEGDLGEFSDDGSASYETTFACDADEGTHENTATIVETDQTASASVTVNCYDLAVTKDADESFTRTYEWTIDKSSDDPAELTLNPGESYSYPYEVTVDVSGSTDSDFAVSGEIHVDNPAPIDAVITDVSDIVSTAIAADVDCGVTFPYTLVAGDTLECTYETDLADGADRTNTATATNQNYDFDSAGVGTESGTTDYSGSADVDFDGVVPSAVDDCIDVTDTLQGALGTVCVGDTLPKTFSYSRTIQPTEEDCDGLTIMNTASFVTDDTGATGDDDWTVVVTVPCEEGCTLTQGYWKTHSDYGPAKKSDPTWDLLAGGLGPDTTFFLSGQTWYEVFWTSPKKGNAYYNLAHQYMAAKLNLLSGATSTAGVDAAITWAETFFSTYTPSNWPKALKTTIVQNAGVLGSYNEGLTGPGHCDEDATARRANR